MTVQTDIVIAGGGLVGAALALLLTRRHPQWSVTVVEPFLPTPNAGQPGFDARVTALSDGSRLILNSLGL